MTSLKKFAVIVVLPLLTASFAYAKPSYEASVQHTQFGIPHVTAKTIGSAGYGYGYAYAEENICLLQQRMATLAGERSMHFGPDAPTGESVTYGPIVIGARNNLTSDFAYRHLLNEQTLAKAFDGLSPEASSLIKGYVGGVNRYLKDYRGKLPVECNQKWVRAMTEADMYRIMLGLAMFTSSGRFLDGFVDAKPPVKSTPVAQLQPEDAALKVAEYIERNIVLGSNGVGIGRDATENGSGILFGNPHFPWAGALRFHQVHLTVPGQMDVMGATIGGFPIPLVAFNKDVAWTTTVSTGARFTLYELQMKGSTHYVVDGVAKPLTTHTVKVKARRPDGTLEERTHTFYGSEWGPIVTLPGIDWTADRAFAIQDAMLESARMIEQWIGFAKVRSVEELKTSAQSIVGSPYVNIIAADRHGEVLYTDTTMTPAVSDEKIADCATSPVAKAMLKQRTFVLDGSRSACQWTVDAETGRRTIPGKTMPFVKRTDYVNNSNDSAWLANPAQLNSIPQIVGRSPSQQSLRSRMVFTEIADRLSGKDGRPGKKFSVRSMESAYFDNRSMAAELAVDGIISLCRSMPTAVASNGKSVDLTPACNSLAQWNRRMSQHEAGVPVFREFWRTARAIPNLFKVPFSAEDPVNTPREMNTTDATVAKALLTALADSVELTSVRGVGFADPLAKWQWFASPMGRLPIDGGDEFEGVFNKITPKAGLGPNGYEPSLGVSYLQLVTFNEAGPVARGLLAYSQSTNPASPHHADQTWVYSRQTLVPLPFHPAEIAATAQGKPLSLAE